MDDEKKGKLQTALKDAGCTEEMISEIAMCRYAGAYSEKTQNSSFRRYAYFPKADSCIGLYYPIFAGERNCFIGMEDFMRRYVAFLSMIFCLVLYIHSSL